MLANVVGKLRLAQLEALYHREKAAAGAGAGTGTGTGIGNLRGAGHVFF
jgi:hypothetical protein